MIKMLNLAEDSRKVTPTDKTFKKGQKITYKGVLYTRKEKNMGKTKKQIIIGGTRGQVPCPILNSIVFRRLECLHVPLQLNPISEESFRSSG